MTFPTSPTNGQSVTLNGVEYTYNSTKTAWLKTTAGSGTVPATVSGTLTVTGNANVGNLGTAAIVATGNATIASFTSITNLGLVTRTGAGNFGVRIIPGGGGDANAAVLQFTNAAETTQNGTISVTGSAMSIGTDVNTPLALRVNGSNVTTVAAGTVTVVANVLPSANVTYNLGSATARWANVFVGDLNLSNGIGDYTILEGETNLYLINNKSGKTFKFLVEEVDPSEVPPKINS